MKRSDFRFDTGVAQKDIENAERMIAKSEAMGRYLRGEKPLPQLQPEQLEQIRRNATFTRGEITKMKGRRPKPKPLSQQSLAYFDRYGRKGRRPGVKSKRPIFRSQNQIFRRLRANNDFRRELVYLDKLEDIAALIMSRIKPRDLRKIPYIDILDQARRIRGERRGRSLLRRVPRSPVRPSAPTIDDVAGYNFGFGSMQAFLAPEDFESFREI
jgi:hypothetical protein